MRTLHMAVSEEPEVGAWSGLAALSTLSFSWPADRKEPLPCPRCFTRLPALKNLSARVVRFSDLPPGLGQMPELQELDLSCATSFLKEFPSLSGCRELRRFVASGNSVQGWPLPSYGLLPMILEAVRGLGNLEILEVDGWREKRKSEVPSSFLAPDGRRTLPEVFSGLRRLRRLSLWKNRLEKVPDSVLELTQLEELLINENRLAPAEIERVRLALPRTKIRSDLNNPE